MIGLIKAVALVGAMIGSHFEAPALTVWEQVSGEICATSPSVAKMDQWCAIRDHAWRSLRELGWVFSGKDGWLPYDQMRAICLAESASDPQHVASIPGACSAAEGENWQPDDAFGEEELRP